MNGVHDAAYLLAFFTILSQLLGLVRDRLFAAYFGAGRALDIYYASFRIPDLIFVTVASVVSISVLVPLILERVNGDKHDLKKFIDSVFNFFFLAIVTTSIIAFFAIPFLSKLMFPGFGGEDSAELILLTRIILLSPIFLGLSNFFSSITQAFRRFFIYAISPLLYNLGIIVGLIFFYPAFGMAGLAYGVVLGAFLHLLMQVPFAVSHGLAPRISFNIDFSIVKKITSLSIFRTLAMSANQIAIVFLVAIGSTMTVGSIAVFNLSWNLQSVPLAIVGASYSMALFPTISRFFNEGRRSEFLEHMQDAARHIIFWSVPITVLFVVLRAQVVRTILGAGEFSWSDTRLTAAALAIFSISVVAQSLVLLFTRGYYASGRTRKPLVINVISAILVIIFSFLSLKIFYEVPVLRYFVESLFRVGDITGTEVLVLPLGYTLAMVINAVLLWVSFHKEFKEFSRTVFRSLFQVTSSALIMGFVAYAGLNFLSGLLPTETAIGIFLQGFIAGMVGIFVGIGMLYLLENRELQVVRKTLRDKIWRVKVIVPEQESL